jgi:acetyl esterase/lipase
MRPSWSLKLEAIIGVQRGTYGLLSAIGPLRYQRTLEASIPSIDSGGTTLETSDAPQVPGHWFIPPTHDENRVILYFHGGGYVYGSAKTHGKMIGTIARISQTKALALDYRLGPIHPQPAAIEDACAAFRHLVQTGTPPGQIIFAGDSAGGGLVIAAMLALRDAGDPLPAAGVAISPWVDLTCTDDSFDKNAPFDPVTRKACLVAAAGYLDGLSPKDPTVSPLFAKLEGLPPLLLHAGEIEVLKDQICAFDTRAKAAGIDTTLNVYDDMVHVWHMLLGFTPQADAAIEEIAAFIQTHTNTTHNT